MAKTGSIRGLKASPWAPAGLRVTIGRRSGPARAARAPLLGDDFLLPAAFLPCRPTSRTFATAAPRNRRRSAWTRSWGRLGRSTRRTRGSRVGRAPAGRAGGLAVGGRWARVACAVRGGGGWSRAASAEKTSGHCLLLSSGYAMFALHPARGSSPPCAAAPHADYDKRKYMWKLLYTRMLGYDVDFGHKQAMDLIAAPGCAERGGAECGGGRGSKGNGRCSCMHTGQRAPWCGVLLRIEYERAPRPVRRYAQKQVGYVACSVLLTEVSVPPCRPAGCSLVLGKTRKEQHGPASVHQLDMLGERGGLVCQERPYVLRLGPVQTLSWLPPPAARLPRAPPACRRRTSSCAW